MCILRQTMKVARAWGQLREYRRETPRDGDALGERIAIVYGHRDPFKVFLYQKFVKVEDYEIIPLSVDTLDLERLEALSTEDRTERVPRKLLDVIPAISRKITDKTYLSLGYAYNSAEYDPDYLFDWHESSGHMEIGYKATDKTDLLLLGQYSKQASDGFIENADFYVVRAGALYEVTAKTKFKGSVGFERYQFGERPEESQNLDKDLVNFDLRGYWDATDKVTIELGGRNGIQPAVQYLDNTKVVSILSAGIYYDVTERIIASIGASFRQDDYVGKVFYEGQFRDKRREHVGYRVRCDYHPRVKFIDLFGEVTYEDVETNVEDDYPDYDQWRFSLGCTLRY